MINHNTSQKPRETARDFGIIKVAKTIIARHEMSGLSRLKKDDSFVVVSLPFVTILAGEAVGG